MRTQSKQIDFSGQNFYCGIDTHKKNWAVTIETDDFALKTFTQNADPELIFYTSLDDQKCKNQITR